MIYKYWGGGGEGEWDLREQGCNPNVEVCKISKNTLKFESQTLRFI